MNIEIKLIENPIRHFATFLNLAESFINDVVCVETPEKKLTQTKEDFSLLEDAIYLTDYEENPYPDEVRESMYRGITFVFSEILTKDFGLKWCIVSNGPFPGEGMVQENTLKVIYLRKLIDDYIAETGEIDFQEIHNNISRLLNCKVVA